jgi:hypothetical protein
MDADMRRICLLHLGCMFVEALTHLQILVSSHVPASLKQPITVIFIYTLNDG